SPYTSGYEITPRTGADILPHPGPQILTGPTEGSIQPHQVAISWTTDVNSTSKVDYGLTANYELGAVSDNTPVTSHAITLTGLNPATIFHYRVESANQNGNTQSGDHLFCSGSGPECTGQILVYFNHSVDGALSEGYPANGNVNLEGMIISMINAA